MSAFNLANFMQITEDGNHFNFWDAPFTNMHLYVPEQTRIVVNAQWDVNLPGLAAQYLGSRYLYWTIMMYNGISDPLRDMPPGTVLKIPQLAALTAYLQNQTSSNTASNYLPGLSATML